MKIVLFLFLMFTAMLLAGCGILAPSWDLPSFNPTDIVPAYAYYKVVSDPVINDDNHREFAFSVERDEETLKPILVFSSDGYRYDRISITRGAFYHKWGDLGGTDCPTDSYAISGHFTEVGKAEGIIKLAYNGRVIAAATFVATPRMYIIYPE